MSTGDRDTIRTFISTQLAKRAGDRSIADGDDLLSSGVVDSLGILHLVSFLESSFRVRIRDEDIVPDHFASVEAIAEFVANSRRVQEAS